MTTRLRRPSLPRVGCGIVLEAVLPFVLLGTSLLLALALALAFLFRRPVARWYVRRRWARLAAFRDGIAPGDRCWVVLPTGGAPRRMTVRHRDGQRVALLMYVDAADGERCLLGIHVIRLFPYEPSDWEIEAVNDAERDALREPGGARSPS